MHNHYVIRQNDEFYCYHCGSRWGLKDTPPKKCIKIKLSL